MHLTFENHSQLHSGWYLVTIWNCSRTLALWPLITILVTSSCLKPWSLKCFQDSSQPPNRIFFPLQLEPRSRPIKLRSHKHPQFPLLFNFWPQLSLQCHTLNQSNSVFLQVVLRLPRTAQKSGTALLPGSGTNVLYPTSTAGSLQLGNSLILPKSASFPPTAAGLQLRDFPHVPNLPCWCKG